MIWSPVGQFRAKQSGSRSARSGRPSKFPRCAASGGDALPVDSSYDAQRDTIEYVCPACGTRSLEQVH
jgi:hypothetical protein